MSRRRTKLKVGEIDWRKIDHIAVGLTDGDTLSLKLKPTTENLPKVTIITLLNDIVLFQFSLYSWKTMVYPKDLLEWVILDQCNILKEDLNDPRIRVVRDKGPFNELVGKVIDEVKVSKVTEPSVERPQESPTTEVAVKRNHHYMFMACGDIMFPDTLAVKHRALVQKKKDAVVPNALAYYNPFANSSTVYKYFPIMPLNGLYFKRCWWNFQSSSKACGLSYIGNCVTIGQPNFPAVPQSSSFPFYKNFPLDVKTIIKKMISVADHYRDIKDEGEDEPAII